MNPDYVYNRIEDEIRMVKAQDSLATAESSKQYFAGKLFALRAVLEWMEVQ